MLAFVDSYLKTPVNHCVNQFNLKTKIPTTYHMPGQFGFETMDSISEQTTGYIILGSTSNVTEPLSWHQELAQRIHKELRNGKPVLAICFGHQLMANHFNCEIDYLTENKEYFKELREIRFEKNWGRYKADERINLAYAHEQAILKLDSCFEILASSSRSQYEVIQHKSLPLVCTQAHPEASELFLEKELNTTQKHDGFNFLINWLNTLPISHE